MPVPPTERSSPGLCQGLRQSWEETPGLSRTPILQTHRSRCLWMQLMASTEMGPHKPALNAASLSTYTNLHFHSCQHCKTNPICGFARQSHSSSCWKSRQSVCLAPPPACSRTARLQVQRVRGTASHKHPLFPRDLSDAPIPTSPHSLPRLGAVKSATPAAAQNQRWSVPIAATWQARTTQSSAGAHHTGTLVQPTTRAPLWSPGTNIPAIQRAFHRGPGFSKGPSETHHARNVQGGIVRLLVKEAIYLRQAYK